MKSKKQDNILTKDNEVKLIRIFKIVLFALTFVFYYNAIFNHFSMDDYHVNIENEQIAKGIAGIPEIFTSAYAEESGMSYGYRPIVRASFALEYQLTSGLEINPYISHFISILLYALSILVLYKVLRRILRGYNPWFAFLVTLLFMAHPTHTEVVASLKNRDVILNFLFSFLAIWQFIKWVDVKKSKNLIFGMVYFVLALLSKESAIAQLAVFPLVLYFFTDIKLKKLGTFTAISMATVILVFVARWLILPEASRDLKMWENPLIVTDSFILHIGTAIYIIGHYIKLLFVPFPLLYYYGYNMIPVVGLTNPWVLITLAALLGMLYYVVRNFKSKDILSFAILYFVINISMYANIVAPVPGIVADRFVFFATLSFAILITWLFFTIFGIKLKKQEKKNSRIIWVSLLVLLIISPYWYYVNIRNKHWQTKMSLYSADMPRLENSVKANTLYAHELMKKANAELAKPVNPYKFIIGTINKAEMHYKKALELDSTHYSSWNNLGIINSKIHGNQAKLRVQSYLKRNEVEKADKERQLSIKYFSDARHYFEQAIRYNPKFGSAYFNFANSYDLQQKYDSAVIYFKKAVEVDGGELVSMSRLANSYYRNNQFREAIDLNDKIISKFPNSDKPYINLGNYAFQSRDTLKGIQFFEKAVQLGTRPEVGQLLSNYYKSIGDTKKSDYYFRKSYEAEQLARNKKK